MNSPYMGKFRVSQRYSQEHTGLDLVGIDSKEIHSTVNGVVSYAGWENASNHKKGFGLYVRIKDNKTGYQFYFGHLSEIKVKVGQAVKITDIIGVEGNTGHSTGSHCHYESRKDVGVNFKGTVNISEISGIPNNVGCIYDDGYRSSQSIPSSPSKKSNEEIADEVIAGKWDKGQARKDKLAKAGYNYAEVQRIVNAKLR